MRIYIHIYKYNYIVHKINTYMNNKNFSCQSDCLSTSFLFSGCTRLQGQQGSMGSSRQHWQHQIINARQTDRQHWQKAGRQP